MGKRFTDTEKWKKPFIRGLQGAYKLLWFYICDDCDHSGIWQVDIDVAEIRIGEKIDKKIALKNFGEKIIELDNGSKWFIPSFIEFQYPSGLSRNNKAHGGIIKNLEKYSLLNENLEIEIKGLARGLNAPMDKDIYKDKEMDKDKEIKPKNFDFKFSLLNYGFNPNLVDDWLKVRKEKGGINTETAFKKFIQQIELCSEEKNVILEVIIWKNWIGFEKKWWDNLADSDMPTHLRKENKKSKIHRNI